LVRGIPAWRGTFPPASVDSLFHLIVVPVLCALAEPPSILIFTISAANSDQYIATRTLYGMAKDGNAPRIFTKCTKRGVPWVAFIFTGMFMGLAFLVASDDALTVFNYFTSAVTIFVSGEAASPGIGTIRARARGTSGRSVRA
jgi:L-asparagine transporter-like permease